MRKGRPHLTESRQRYAHAHDEIARQAREARRKAAREAQTEGAEPAPDEEEDRETR